MNMPSLDGLDGEQRAIMLGALAILQGMLTQGMQARDETGMAAAIDAATKVRELITGTYDPVTAIEEWIHLEGKLWLS